MFTTTPVPFIEKFDSKQITEFLSSDWFVDESNDFTQFSSGVFAEFIFSFCNEFGFEISIKMNSLFLFQEFLHMHLKELHEIIYSSSCSNKEASWNDVLERMAKHIPLRLCSCIQIQTKYASRIHYLEPKTIRNFLVKRGYNFTHQSILKSEKRILTTIKYKIIIKSANIIDCIGYYISLLDLNTTKRQLLFETSCYLLELTLIDSKIHQLVELKHKSNIPIKTIILICSSSYIIDQRESDKVIQVLCKQFGIDTDDLLKFICQFLENIV